MPKETLTDLKKGFERIDITKLTGNIEYQVSLINKEVFNLEDSSPAGLAIRDVNNRGFVTFWNKTFGISPSTVVENYVIKSREGI